MPHATLPGPAPRFDPRRRRAVTFALLLVTALASFESTVVTTAMPTIIGDLHGLPLYSWVFSVYLFGSTITMPVYGRLADVHGRRRMLLLAIALFAGSPLPCALARTMPPLIAARGLQGLGAGGLIPLALTVSGDLYSMEERARIQGLFSSIWGVSSLVGPLAGAFLTMTAGWRSIFVLNLPLGFLAAWIVATRMIETPASTREGAPPPGVLSLLRRRETAWPYASAALMGIALYGVSTYVPLYVQGARGGTAGSAGAVVTPLILFWAVSAPAGGRPCSAGSCSSSGSRDSSRRRRSTPRRRGSARRAPSWAAGSGRRRSRSSSPYRKTLPPGSAASRRASSRSSGRSGGRSASRRWARSSRPACRRGSGPLSNPRAALFPARFPRRPSSGWRSSGRSSRRPSSPSSRRHGFRRATIVPVEALAPIDRGPPPERRCAALMTRRLACALVAVSACLAALSARGAEPLRVTSLRASLAPAAEFAPGDAAGGAAGADALAFHPIAVPGTWQSAGIAG